MRLKWFYLSILVLLLELMKRQVEVALACLISLLWIQQIFCVADELPDASGSNKWTCRCTSDQGDPIYSLANCSTSCSCSLDAGGSGSIWTCICDANGFPKVAADSHIPKCFAACNCTSGAGAGGLSPVEGSRKHISSKVVVVILLVCVILTTAAFLASVICCINRRDRFFIQPRTFLSDKETSYNSNTNLIAHKAFSVPETKITIVSPNSHIPECFHKASWLFGCKSRALHGSFIQFSYTELDNATEKFSNSNLIGVGGSSYVHRGRLSDGRIVAVKRLKAQRESDAESVFLTEIELLSRLHHCHLVPLLGYCLHSKGKHSERLLVFQYMSNGNLRECLDGTLGKDLNWSTRVAIAIGTARGLEYLHEAAVPKILHRDVKSTNILLDENWQAKITDFGMAKKLRADDNPSSPSSPTRMQGTFGYFAPECAIVGRPSLKSDVFSFGVVLLELISGRRPIYKPIGRGEESLVIWATPRLQDKRQIMTELPDPRLNGDFADEEMLVMAYLARECLLLDPDARPAMRDVVQILSTISLGKRKKFPMSLFQGLPAAHFMNSEPSVNAITPHQGQHLNVHVQGIEEQREIESHKTHACYSLQLNIEQNFDVTTSCHKKEADNVSAEYMDRLVMLTSKVGNCPATSDEAVDLTQPQLESFCMTHVNFSRRTLTDKL